MEIIQFLFIILVPLVLVAGGLVTIFALGALLDALEDPDELKKRIEAAFRRPPKPAKPPDPDHYYRAYWQGGATAHPVEPPHAPAK
jgi:hypothetical protein